MRSLRHNSPFGALFATVGIFTLCSLAAVMLTALVFTEGIQKGHYATLVICQSLNTVLMFGVPAIWASRMSFGSWTAIMKGEPSTWRRTLLALSIIVMVQGLIAWASYVNEQFVSLPALQSINFQSVNEANASLLAQLLRFGTPLEWTVTIVVAAILPALCEEFFFRGLLQTVFVRTSKSAVASIIIASFIFSAMHMEMSAFLPRFMLGCLLGTIYYMTSNIWLSVMAHAVNNVGTLVSIYILSTEMPMEKLLLEPTENPGVIIPLLSLTMVFMAFQTLSLVVNAKK